MKKKTIMDKVIRFVNRRQKFLGSKIDKIETERCKSCGVLYRQQERMILQYRMEGYTDVLDELDVLEREEGR
jgi:hypothetical protein